MENLDPFTAVALYVASCAIWCTGTFLALMYGVL
jgi:hypothetical protein